MLSGKKSIVPMLIVPVIIGLLLVSVLSCSTTSTVTSTTTNAPSTTTVTSTTTNPPSTITTTTTLAIKTLKIGGDFDYSNPTGINGLQAMQFMAEMTNQSGGLVVGGDKYNIEIIAYDDENDETKSVTNINRLVYQDKVQYIIGGLTSFVPAWLPITEPNKVVLCVGSSALAMLSPDVSYCFNTCSSNSLDYGYPIIFTSKFPDAKSFVYACAEGGDVEGIEHVKQLFKMLGGGRTLDIEMAPQGATDLSALGTKIKTLNPDILMSSGGPIFDAQAIKAARNAGYTGQVLGINSAPYVVMLSVASPQDLEGAVMGAGNTEFDPPLTQQAKDFKDAWIAKNGKWDAPELVVTNSYTALMTAFQKAGSVDADHVAAVIGNGLSWEGPYCSGKMISRPDQGNSRTVDAAIATAFKQIKDGKVTLFFAPTADEMAGYLEPFFQYISK